MAEKKEAVTTTIYTDVKKKIIQMELMPGQLLMVQRISEESGLSRTPVREALVRLRSEGLLEDADGRKFRVAQITWKLISDTYEARAAIEALAASQVAAGIRRSQLNTLQKLLDQMTQCLEKKDYYAYFECDHAFHDKILQFYGNQVVLNWMNYISDQQQRIRYLTMQVHARQELSLAEHRKIVEMLAAHDSAGAAAAMQQHLERALHDILELRGQPYNWVLNVIRD